jgi:hypothetical protein
VKNHDFTQNKIIFYPILGGGAGCTPLDPPLQTSSSTQTHYLKYSISVKNYDAVMWKSLYKSTLRLTRSLERHYLSIHHNNAI